MDRLDRHTASVFVSAPDVSGDLSAAPVVGDLRRRLPSLRYFGLGGQALAGQEVELWATCDELAVTGLSEAGRMVLRTARLFASMVRRLRQQWPALAILVDYPGLNMRLAQLFHRRGVPVLYFLAPQRWAWMPGRTSAIARCVDTLAVALPFEQPWFRHRGVDATWVGHPLVDRFQLADPAVVRSRLALDRRPVVAVLPGSRDNEVCAHLPLLRQALRRVPWSQPVLAVATERTSRRCAEIAPELPQITAAEAFAVADVALCKSGTATLEAALAGVPTVAFYRLSWVSYQVARRLLRTPYVALPNVLAGRPIVPELLQQEMSPQALAEAVGRLLDPVQARRQREELAQVAAMLGPPGVATRVADLAEALLDRRDHRS